MVRVDWCGFVGGGRGIGLVKSVGVGERKWVVVGGGEYGGKKREGKSRTFTEFYNNNKNNNGVGTYV